MNKQPETLVPVRFSDCDPFGHLNNARYLDYFLNTREDQIRDEYGLDFLTVANTEGVSWVVGQNQVSYFRPASYGEQVRIESQVFAYTDKTLRVEMKMWDCNKTSLKALLWVTFMHIDMRTQKLVAHAPKYLKLFEKVVLPLEEKTFEQRVQHTLQRNKVRAAAN